MQPKASRDTFSPVEPMLMYSILSPKWQQFYNAQGGCADAAQSAKMLQHERAA